MADNALVFLGLDKKSFVTDDDKQEHDDKR